MRKSGGVSGNPTGGAAIVFENDCREWRNHTVGMVDNGRHGVIRQLSLQSGLPVVVVPSGNEGASRACITGNGIGWIASRTGLPNERRVFSTRSPVATAPQ